MLQEKLYPGWARPIRRWWQRGWNRIILFWIVVVTSSFVVIFVIATDYIQWDKLNRDFLPTNELSRAFLASFILVMDLMIVMQVGKKATSVVAFRPKNHSNMNNAITGNLIIIYNAMFGVIYIRHIAK